jgi:tetratricopeptide (TPR) repeat protein
MLYYRLGKHELAAAKINAVLATKPGDADAMMLAGWIALDRGRADRALEYFEAALAILPPAKAEKAQYGRERAVRAGARVIQPQDAGAEGEPR